MLNIKLKGFDVDAAMKAALLEAEQALKKKAQAAARPHGGVTVEFKRDRNGQPASMVFKGSDAAIAAATKAVGA